ncbi:purine nucleoside phosphorylase [bacterium SM23_31]|nr:MAG: purine nucleoside phosphorylase [bacterium SM23_31]
MSELREAIDKAVNVIRNYTDFVPQVGIILGTGLGGLVKDISIEVEIPYKDIPDFPPSTVEFHAGKLILGTLGGKNVAAMQGRFHIYEGYTMQQITFPVRVLKQLGAGTLIISNACGGLNPEFNRGDIMIMTDHINLLDGNPLIGPNDNALGPRFPDMSEPYSRELIAGIELIAKEKKIKVRKGVYAAMTGPSLETAAEYKMLRIIGADAVGMSTVPEVIVGVHMGMKILGLSVVTDLCIPETLQPVNIDEIIRIAGEAEPKLTLLIKRLVEEL